jgi:tRNA A-37 threonylcarbamoyl transferase component Bud32
MKADANPLKIVSVGTIFLLCFAILVFSLLMLRWDTASPAHAYADPLAQNPIPTVANPLSLIGTPTVDVDNSSYTVGDSMTVTLSGFSANSTVSLTVQATDGSNAHELNSVTTDATGASTTIHTVPSSPIGTVEIVATDGAVTATSSTFTINEKAAAPPPAPAPAPTQPLAQVYYPPAPLAATPTPTDIPIPTPSDTPTPTPTDTPTPTPSVVPIVTHSGTLPTEQSGNNSPIIPIFIGLGMVASMSVLVVIGFMLLRRNLSPMPATNLLPSGAPAWSRSRGNSMSGKTLIAGTPDGSLQGNTRITGTPQANNGLPSGHRGPRIGQQLGNYRLVGFLGSGGFADVYLGQHVLVQNLYVAIKILHAKLAQNYRSGFLHEAETIARLRHSHIIRIHDYGIDSRDNAPYLIMEYAPLGTLRNMHPRGSIVPPGTVVSYVKQIAEALQNAHDHNIIHRDLKPENILLVQNNEIVVSDFGIAAIALSSHSIKTDAYAGTVLYSAPEQIMGKPRRQSDQYSLGIIVYEWLTGELPFRGTLPEIISQHIGVLPPPLRERLPDIPPAVEAVIMKALAKDPKGRFEGIQAFATAFEQA